jgi:hypothetical protein
VGIWPNAGQKQSRSPTKRDLCCAPGSVPGVVDQGPITDEGVAVGGAFDSDTATGMMPAAQRVAGVLTSWRS